MSSPAAQAREIIPMRGTAHPFDHDHLERFEMWLRASDRAESTIGLRMRYVLQLSEKVPLMHATTDDLERVFASRRHLAPETRKSMLASWRVFYGWAVARGLVASDPTVTLGSVRVRHRMPRVAPDDVVIETLEHGQLRDQALVVLARYACLRLTEITTLHTRDRQGEWLTVLGKGDKERRVHLNPQALAIIRRVEAEQGKGYYFPGGTDGHLHPVSVSKIIRRLTGWNPHSLRHAGATAAYQATHNLRGVQAMLGHASMATTQRYLHLDDDALRDVGEATAIRRRHLRALNSVA